MLQPSKQKTHFEFGFQHSYFDYMYVRINLHKEKTVMESLC